LNIHRSNAAVYILNNRLAALTRSFSSILLSLGHAPVSSLLHIVPAALAPVC
jgi:hypothetical protein